MDQLKFLPQEMNLLDDYLNESKTSVLTIMFTDIEGYTEYTDKMGDQKANEVRKFHDEIMVQEIEGGSKGKIIKYIGDAVMAVFAEPSSSLNAAVAIQRSFHQHYEQGTFPLKVRIGLHMGQVTIESKLGQDIFGRHVNKAARVESQASGGQIFTTYPVIETIKGNVEIPNVSFVNHGEFKAKGIEESFDLYEILYLKSQKPKAPATIKDKLIKPKVLVPVLSLLVVLIVSIYFVMNPKLYMFSVPKAPLIFDKQKTLLINNVENQEYKEIEQRIPVGKHVIYYQVSSVVRYYAFMEVKPFMEFFKPEYKYYQAPEHVFNFLFKDDENHSDKKQKQLSIKIPDNNFIDRELNFSFSTIQSFQKSDEGNLFKIVYEVVDARGKKYQGEKEIMYKNESKSSKSENMKIAKYEDLNIGISLSVWKDSARIRYYVDFSNKKYDY